MAERLATKTPLVIVTTEPDAIITVQKASIGKHPKADYTITLADGTMLWQGNSKARGFNLVGRSMSCPIAVDLLDNLRKAMKQARDK